jgi:hypothetical protein
MINMTLVEKKKVVYINDNGHYTKENFDEFISNEFLFDDEIESLKDSDEYKTVEFTNSPYAGCEEAISVYWTYETKYKTFIPSTNTIKTLKAIPFFGSIESISQLKQKSGNEYTFCFSGRHTGITTKLEKFGLISIKPYKNRKRVRLTNKGRLLRLVCSVDKSY